MSAIAVGEREAVHSFVEHEHSELRDGIEVMHQLACELPTYPASEILVEVGRIHRWIDSTLRPHMAWEEIWLFPQIDDRTRTHWATRLVRFDHRQIGRLAEHVCAYRLDDQRSPVSQTVAALRCDLLALEAVVRAHMEREEELLLPLLETDAGRWVSEWQG